MALPGRYFPGQSTSERVFLVLRRSFITYIAFLLIAAIMALPILVLAIAFIRYPDFFSNPQVNAVITLAGSAYLLFIIGLLFYGFIDHYLDVYIITDERIVDIRQTGFFKREISELHLREVQDVSALVKGFIPTVFHFGDIYIQTAGEHENFTFYAVPHPYRVSKKIADLHENQIERDRLRLQETLLGANRVQAVDVTDNLNTQTQSPVPINDAQLEPATNPIHSSQLPADYYVDRNIQNESNFVPRTKQDLVGTAPTQINPNNESNSSRGIADEEITPPSLSEISSNVEKGLDDIDQYIAETKDAERKLNPTDPRPLQEGRIEDIIQDD